jgi:hypothetical protein
MKFLILPAVLLCSSIYSFGQASPAYDCKDRGLWGATIFKKIKTDTIKVDVKAEKDFYAVIIIKGKLKSTYRKDAGDTIPIIISAKADRITKIKIIHKKKDHKLGCKAEYVDSDLAKIDQLTGRSGTIKSPASGGENVSTTVTSL